MFSKNLRLIYLYLVSIIALFVTIFALISTAGSITDLIVGNPYYGKEVYASDGMYQYRKLFNTCAFWVVSFPVYWFHWREIQKGRDEIVEVISEGGAE